MTKRVICYASFPDKALKYVAQTLPAVYAAAGDAPSDPVFDNWFHRNIAPRSMATALQRLQQLHRAVRNGRYVEELDASGRDVPCDAVRTLRETLLHGGDCEDWAAVLLAGAGMIGVRAWLVTSGETHDNYLHICAAAEVGNTLLLLDPKGDSYGAPFNVRSETYGVRRYWTKAPAGRVLEVHFAPEYAA